MEATWVESGVFFGVFSVGVASAGAMLQSVRHQGKWRWVGLVLGLIYLCQPWVIPYAVGVIHLLVIPAAFTVGLAIANTPPRRSQE